VRVAAAKAPKTARGFECPRIFWRFAASWRFVVVPRQSAALPDRQLRHSASSDLRPHVRQRPFRRSLARRRLMYSRIHARLRSVCLESPIVYFLCSTGR
jgi:hypothetical protein